MLTTEHNPSSLPFLSHPWELYSAQLNPVKLKVPLVYTPPEIKPAQTPIFLIEGFSSFHLRIAVLLLHRVRVRGYPEYVVAPAQAGGLCVSPQHFQ